MHADPIGIDGMILVAASLILAGLVGRRLPRFGAAVCLAIGVWAWIIAGVLFVISMQPEPPPIGVSMALGWSAYLASVLCMAGVTGTFRAWERGRGRNERMTRADDADT